MKCQSVFALLLFQSQNRQAVFDGTFWVVEVLCVTFVCSALQNFSQQHGANAPLRNRTLVDNAHTKKYTAKNIFVKIFGVLDKFSLLKRVLFCAGLFSFVKNILSNCYKMKNAPRRKITTLWRRNFGKNFVAKPLRTNRDCKFFSKKIPQGKTLRLFLFSKNYFAALIPAFVPQ